MNTESEKRAVSSTKVPTLDVTVFPIRFPPFPAVPQGISIVPFKDFVPCGYKRIRTQAGEEIEVDVFGGLPTVKVLSEEEAAQRIKDRKKRRNAGQSTDATGRIVPWWEEWEEGESSRRTRESMELYLYPFPLLELCSFSFTTGRRASLIASTKLPMISGLVVLGRQYLPGSGQCGIMYSISMIVLGIQTDRPILQFRLYIGLLSSLPIYRKVKKSKGAESIFYEADDNVSDDNNAPRAKQINIDITQDPLEQIAHPGKKLLPGGEEADLESRLLQSFIDDTENSIKTFLSSYMRDKGLIW